MAFKILTDPTFTTQAVINVPTDAGILEQTVTARFRMLPVEDGELTLADFVAKALISLDGIENDKGEALVWSPALAKACLQYPFVQMGLWRAYGAAMVGAKQGN